MKLQTKGRRVKGLFVRSIRKIWRSGRNVGFQLSLKISCLLPPQYFSRIRCATMTIAVYQTAQTSTLPNLPLGEWEINQLFHFKFHIFVQTKYT